MEAAYADLKAIKKRAPGDTDKRRPLQIPMEEKKTTIFMPYWRIGLWTFEFDPEGSGIFDALSRYLERNVLLEDEKVELPPHRRFGHSGAPQQRNN